MRFAVGFCILAFSPVIFAGEPRIHRDLAYFEPKEQHRTLDVYTSAQSKNQPIAFWIHGGGWREFSGTAPGFYGANLARAQDVVVITVNDRLNAFGYLRIHPLSTADISRVPASTASTLPAIHQ